MIKEQGKQLPQKPPHESTGNAYTNGIIPTITTLRQKRLISHIALMEVSSHHLRNLVGSDNIWEEIRRLRLRGWHIHTIKKPQYDRDGHKVQAGYYQLDPKQLPFAMDIINSS